MVSKKMVFPLKGGLHARPASEIINYLRNFNSDIKMICEGRSANCKSIISLLALGVKPNTEIEIVVNGESEVEELNSFTDFLYSLSKEI